MNTTLKTLKETKGIKKEFSFITPLTELIQKEYEDLVPLMDVDTYGVAIDEVLEKYEFLASYSSLDEIRTLPFTTKFRYNLTDSKDKGDKKGLIKNFTSQLPSFNLDPTVTLNREEFSWGIYRVKISDIYVVTDEKAFEEYALAYIIEEEEKAIKRAKESTKCVIEENSKESLNTKLYGKRYKKKDNANLTLGFMEMLDAEDTKKKFEKASDFITSLLEESGRNNW